MLVGNFSNGFEIAEFPIFFKLESYKVLLTLFSLIHTVIYSSQSKYKILSFFNLVLL
jgi:hypothetical protein